MVICLERGADLHMAKLMPLLLTVSCFSKIQIGFTFLVPAHLGSPGKGPLNRCVCVSQKMPPHCYTYIFAECVSLGSEIKKIFSRLLAYLLLCHDCVIASHVTRGKLDTTDKCSARADSPKMLVDTDGTRGT